MDAWEPDELDKAIVRACRVAFPEREGLEQALADGGVPREIMNRYRDATPMQMLLDVLAELEERGESGATIRRQFVGELCALQSKLDPEDPETGRRPLTDLRLLAEYLISIEPENTSEQWRSRAQRNAAEQLKATKERASALAELREMFGALAIRTDEAHRLGYELEDLLHRLFEIQGVPYQPPVRSGPLVESDAYFTLAGRPHLVEARWRTQSADLAALRAFSGKVRRNDHEARGLFVSVGGFGQEVLDHDAAALDVFLMDGQDLALILEERISLTEALRLKLDKAANDGVLFYSLVEAG